MSTSTDSQESLAWTQSCQGKAAVRAFHLQLLAAGELAQHCGGRHAMLRQREQERARADEPAALHSRQRRPLHIRNQALCRVDTLQLVPQLSSRSFDSNSWRSIAAIALRLSGAEACIC